MKTKIKISPSYKEKENKYTDIKFYIIIFLLGVLCGIIVGVLFA